MSAAPRRAVAIPLSCHAREWSHARIARLLASLVARRARSCAAAVPPHAETIGGNPGPQYNYVCPNADGKRPARLLPRRRQHLYTMCRHVKSIEIIEFGYEKSQEGVNGAKSEYCVDKQKINITRPYQAALREARRVEAGGRGRARACRSPGSTRWPKLDAGTTANPTTTTRSASTKPYDDFRERIEGIRKIVTRSCKTNDRRPTARKPRARRPQPAPRQARRDVTPRRKPSPDADAGPPTTPTLTAVFGDRRHAVARPPRLSLPPAAARDGAGGRRGDRASARRSSPKPAPAPARRSPTSFPRCSTAARSSSRPAPRRCRTSCSSATCR